MAIVSQDMPEKYAKKKLGLNVHHHSGVRAICPPSKILCDLGQNVLGQNVPGAFCLGAFCMIINVAMLMWLEPDNNVGIMAAVYQCGDA